MSDIKFEEIINVSNLESEFLKSYSDEEVLFLYGAGNSAFQAVQYLRKINIKPRGIIDSDKKKWGTLKFGLSIFSLSEVLEKYPKMQVFISAPSYEDEIRLNLKQYIEEDKIFSIEYERLTYCPTNDYRDYVCKHVNEISEIYDIMADEKSKITLKCVLKSWLSADSTFLKEIYEPNQYFTNTVIHLNENEVFVDCGAYNGDTFREFASKVNGKYKGYYGFEPQKECFDQLVKVCQGNKNNNVTLNLGVYDRKTQLKFDVQDDFSASNVTEDGTQIIDVTALDNEILDNVTFIKMDIEGSELPALRGAEKTIRKNKPKLAICVYHKKEDIVEIPKYIMSLGMDYKLYIRHHQKCSGTETVLYAI